MIEAVLFDLDETLLDRTGSLRAFLRDQHDRYERELGSPPVELWAERFLHLDARGSVSKIVVYPAILEEFGGDALAAETLLHDYLFNCCKHARAFPGALAMLAELRRLGRRLGVVTNGETAFQTRHLNALGLTAAVDAVLISEAEGVRKPDPEIFLRGAARLEAAPSECLFVGDNPVADVLGAHGAGLRTAWFRSGQRWPEDLPANPGPTIDALPEVLSLIDHAATDRLRAC